MAYFDTDPSPDPPVDPFTHALNVVSALLIIAAFVAIAALILSRF